MPHHASCRRARRWIEAKLSERDETNDGLIFAISGGDHDHCMCSAVAVHCWRSLRPRHSARHRVCMGLKSVDRRKPALWAAPQRTNVAGPRVHPAGAGVRQGRCRCRS